MVGLQLVIIALSAAFAARDVFGLSQTHPHCETITAPMCRGLGYNTTRMPNFVGHENQREAILGLRESSSLLSHRCSKFLRLFVCSVYFPLCSEHVPGPVPACRFLCEQVKKDCLPALQAAGFAWPAQLECSRFPEPPDLCMQQPPEDEMGSSGESYSHLQQLKTEHEITIHKCPPGTALIGRKCLKLCGTNLKHPEEDVFILEVWIGVWSIISLVVIVFALLTFMVQPKRFRWPARPILCLTICGLITSLAYFLRWILGSLTCSADTALTKPFDSWLCICSALLITFCDFAFSLWWCTFSYAWYLSASKEWSTEAIEKISARIHSIVWSLSVVPIVYALVSNAIILDDFTGACRVSSHVLTIAQIFIVLLGGVLAALTSRALKNVRAALVNAGRSPFKLERLIYRLGVISLGIALPLLLSLCCRFVSTLHVELAGISARFLSIIFCSLWVFSYKTFRSWNKILRPAFTHKGLRSPPVTKV